MKVLFIAVCVIVSICGSSAKWRPQWSYYTRQRPQCQDTSISLDRKLELAAQYNDNNNNSAVELSDVLYDVNNNYDVNKDGNWTEAECVRRYACAHGDNTVVATYVCVQIFQGAALTKNSSFAQSPFLQNGIPIDQFVGLNRQRYIDFGNNKCVNACLTIDQKATQILLDLNPDNNQEVTQAEALAFYAAFDADGNGQISQFEFVSRWVCRYADSGDFARYVWNQTANGQESASIQSLLVTYGPVNGVRSTLLQRYFTARFSRQSWQMFRVQEYHCPYGSIFLPEQRQINYFNRYRFPSFIRRY